MQIMSALATLSQNILASAKPTPRQLYRSYAAFIVHTKMRANSHKCSQQGVKHLLMLTLSQLVFCVYTFGAPYRTWNRRFSGF